MDPVCILMMVGAVALSGWLVYSVRALRGDVRKLLASFDRMRDMPETRVRKARTPAAAGGSTALRPRMRDRVHDRFVALLAAEQVNHCSGDECTRDAAGTCACPCAPCSRWRALLARAEREIMGRLAADDATGRAAMLPSAGACTVPLEFTEEEIARIDRLAEERGVTREDVIANLIESGLTVEAHRAPGPTPPGGPANDGEHR